MPVRSSAISPEPSPGDTPPRAQDRPHGGPVPTRASGESSCCKTGSRCPVAAHRRSRRRAAAAERRPCCRMRSRSEGRSACVAEAGTGVDAMPVFVVPSDAWPSRGSVAAAVSSLRPPCGRVVREWSPFGVNAPSSSSPSGSAHSLPPHSRQVDVREEASTPPSLAALRSFQASGTATGRQVRGIQRVEPWTCPRPLRSATPDSRPWPRCLHWLQASWRSLRRQARAARRVGSSRPRAGRFFGRCSRVG